MASTLLLVLAVISLVLIPKPNVAESPAEIYWKLKLGSDTVMPEIVKDALTESEENARYLLKHIIQKGFRLSEELELSIKKDAEIVEYLMAYRVTNQEKESIAKLNQESSLGNANLHHQNSNSKSNSTINPTKHSVYFIETDLTHPGKTLKLNFMKTDDGSKFLPVKVAKSIPFSSSKLPQILTIFSVKQYSTGAEIMEDTIQACETKAMSEEMKLCVTTLEDMVDYVISHVGNNVSTFSGYVDKKIQTVHRIVEAKKIEGNSSMVCHKMGYPYAVFYCHNLKETSLYKISMVDSEGMKMNAVGVCHKDTSSWSPSHVSFQILNVKRGSVPVCHFLNERSIAYVEN